MPRMWRRGKEVGDRTGECEGGNGGCGVGEGNG